MTTEHEVTNTFQIFDSNGQPIPDRDRIKKGLVTFEGTTKSGMEVTVFVNGKLRYSVTEPESEKWGPSALNFNMSGGQEIEIKFEHQTETKVWFLIVED
ncbi:hypothetical protein [Pseudomonas brassicacearum]|uniref:Uncharacterized protein n=1 Tax=Pseudomonas brassicacearum TaxID=930166 RepID=A0A423GJ77_9PSED|nr:hypothetical protein [Pseudomonas brassicacearum]ROM90065.1 hypothetical protein BK658_26855 [Pseudomonas brassicacearum]